MKKIEFTPEGWDLKPSKININDLQSIMNQNKTIQGLVESCDENYNLHIKFGNGLNGIMPRNEIEEINVNENGLAKEKICFSKVNKFVQFKIKQIDGNMPILSRRDVQNEMFSYIKHELTPGEIVKGIVKGLTKYGAFIEIGGGIVGLAYIEDLSVARTKNPEDRLKIGQKVNIVVKSINKENNRINLSYKEMFGTWEENANKFTQGMKTKGIVREIEKNKKGIFIELLPNLVGMAEYKEGLEYGSLIDVIIKKIDYNKKKVKLNYC